MFETYVKFDPEVLAALITKENVIDLADKADGNVVKGAKYGEWQLELKNGQVGNFGEYLVRDYDGYKTMSVAAFYKIFQGYAQLFDDLAACLDEPGDENKTRVKVHATGFSLGDEIVYHEGELA